MCRRFPPKICSGKTQIDHKLIIKYLHRYSLATTHKIINIVSDLLAFLVLNKIYLLEPSIIKPLLSGGQLNVAQLT